MGGVGLQVGDSAACCPLCYMVHSDACLAPCNTDMHIKFTNFFSKNHLQALYYVLLESKAIVFKHEYAREFILNSLTVHIK